MKNKHRVGNIVRIKKNLLAYVDEKSRCNGCPVSTLMLQHEGKTATITNAYPDKKYRLDVDNGLCYWTDELLVPVSWEYEMRYDVGERVRIRKDLKERDVFGISIISPSMAEQRGKVATIQSVNQSFYFLDINGEGWTDEMFEPVEEEEKLWKNSPVKIYKPACLAKPMMGVFLLWQEIFWFLKTAGMTFFMIFWRT